MATLSIWLSGHAPSIIARNPRPVPVVASPRTGPADGSRPSEGEGKSGRFDLAFPSMVTRGRGRPPHPDILTPAEWGVLEMWRHGMGRSAIAERRGISQYAVRYHLRNIAGKLGVEHYSELRHWPGFANSSLRKEQSLMAPTTTELDLGQLGQVSMMSKDAAAAERWYKDVLELRHIFTFGDLVFFDLGGTRLYIRGTRGNEEWRPSSILYFVVPDIQVGIRRAAAPRRPFPRRAAHDLQGRQHRRRGMDGVLRRSGRQHARRHGACRAGSRRGLIGKRTARLVGGPSLRLVEPRLRREPWPGAAAWRPCGTG